jgi:hypothetical protein
VKRHFTLSTKTGIEEIYCDDFDDADEQEYWFIHHKKPRVVYRKSNVISISEQRPLKPGLPAFLKVRAAEVEKEDRSQELDAT